MAVYSATNFDGENGEAGKWYSSETLEDLGVKFVEHSVTGDVEEQDDCIMFGGSEAGQMNITFDFPQSLINSQGT